MVFSSLLFLYAFFPLSLVVYYICPTLKSKNVSLLIFSLVFYAWGEPKYVLLLMLMSLFDWFFALQISNTQVEETGRRKLWVVLTCIVDLGLIGYFKYSGMIVSIFCEPPEFIKNIALPIGISFYTFQLLTYVVDVYRDKAPAQKQYWHVLLYAALFHQCIAGPIVRYGSIAEELFVSRNAMKSLPDGIYRFSVGLAKKVILANTCGMLADKFLLSDSTLAAQSAADSISKLATQPVLALWIGVLAFGFQIFFDFSAYSDMAIGMGLMLGLHYPENFGHPYVSHTLNEFWGGWHLTLSTFFRDYVYIPLGGSRRGVMRTYLNTLVVWALTGLWHGASWNYVLWGLYFFVFISLEKAFLLKFFNRLPRAVYEVVTHLYFVIVMMIQWPLFKYTDLGVCVTVIKGLFGGNGNALTGFESVTILKNYAFFIVFALLCLSPLFENIRKKWKHAGETNTVAGTSYSVVAYGVIPVAYLIVSTAFLVGNSYNPFLYFKF